MMIRFDLSPETKARLVAEARALGLPLEKAAEHILCEALTNRSVHQEKMTADDFHQLIDEMMEGSESLPDLPTESFSRDSFYENR